MEENASSPSQPPLRAAAGLLRTIFCVTNNRHRHHRVLIVPTLVVPPYTFVRRWSFTVQIPWKIVPRHLRVSLTAGPQVVRTVQDHGGKCVRAGASVTKRVLQLSLSLRTTHTHTQAQVVTLWAHTRACTCLKVRRLLSPARSCFSVRDARVNDGPPHTITATTMRMQQRNQRGVTTTTTSTLNNLNVVKLKSSLRHKQNNDNEKTQTTAANQEKLSRVVQNRHEVVPGSNKESWREHKESV